MSDSQGHTQTIEQATRPVSRRTFLKGGGAAVAGMAIATTAAAPTSAAFTFLYNVSLPLVAQILLSFLGKHATSCLPIYGRFVVRVHHLVDHIFSAEVAS